MKLLRRVGLDRLHKNRKILLNIGIFPIKKHYYEPQFAFQKEEIELLSKERKLVSIDFNIDEQLDLLETLKNLRYSQELKVKIDNGYFNLNNGFFGKGDVEYYYNFIRYFKPRKIIEIGGNSSIIAKMALDMNRLEDNHYQGELIVVEPYENPWLETKWDNGIKIIRKKVEDLEITIFKELQKNDVLFIDSSHIIRACGDVVFEILDILPNLKDGVLIHFHDIFTPRHYPKEWLVDEIRLWNEQYMLEAFLSYNLSFKIIGTLNYLYNNYFEQLKKVCIFIDEYNYPSSFWIKKEIKSLFIGKDGL